jgi:hypothetical protein
MTERKKEGRKWSAEVTRNSNALDLEADIFGSDKSRLRSPYKGPQSAANGASLRHYVRQCRC